ncbi:DNAJ heat shock N-terminal domain-containing protein [Jimgerdemannia flammicorona]|uniref:Diphthamide biosynthesis protein 4 n=1 Tax=Jimgerdemannia flammicorona TaxID=994334 RepID=A0A433D4T6_9FUNG|nr:DNAJ heat shock N-terminal domain-containing protein [Jimgerdemannia flammicorona]
MSVLSYYEVLNIPETASSDEIKQSFQRLILVHHPDKAIANKTSFDDSIHRILEAWEVLRSSEKRKAYDAQLRAARLKQDGVINAEVDLDDMDYDEASRAYSTPCRCSGRYVITEEDLEGGADTTGCDNCSLRVRVLYVVDEEGG